MAIEWCESVCVCLFTYIYVNISACVCGLDAQDVNVCGCICVLYFTLSSLHFVCPCIPQHFPLCKISNSALQRQRVKSQKLEPHIALAGAQRCIACALSCTRIGPTLVSSGLQQQQQQQQIILRLISNIVNPSRPDTFQQ